MQAVALVCEKNARRQRRSVTLLPVAMIPGSGARKKPAGPPDLRGEQLARLSEVSRQLVVGFIYSDFASGFSTFLGLDSLPLLCGFTVIFGDRIIGAASEDRFAVATPRPVAYCGSLEF